MGSYTGAYSFTEKISSVPVDIDDFYQRESLSLELIVALPYLKREEIGSKAGDQFEESTIVSPGSRSVYFLSR